MMPADPWLLLPLLLACSSEPPVCVVAEALELRRAAVICGYHPVLQCDAARCVVESRFRCVGRRGR